MTPSYDQWMQRIAEGDADAFDQARDRASAERLATAMLAADPDLRRDFGGSVGGLAGHLEATAQSCRGRVKRNAPHDAARSRCHPQQSTRERVAAAGRSVEDLRLLASQVAGDGRMELADLEAGLSLGLGVALDAVATPVTRAAAAARIFAGDAGARAEFGEQVGILEGYLAHLAGQSRNVQRRDVEPLSDAEVIGLCRRTKREVDGVVDEEPLFDSVSSIASPATGSRRPAQAPARDRARADKDDDEPAGRLCLWGAWRAEEADRKRRLGKAYVPRSVPKWLRRIPKPATA